MIDLFSLDLPTIILRQQMVVNHIIRDLTYAFTVFMLIFLTLWTNYKNTVEDAHKITKHNTQKKYDRIKTKLKGTNDKIN